MSRPRKACNDLLTGQDSNLRAYIVVLTKCRMDKTILAILTQHNSRTVVAFNSGHITNAYTSFI